MKNSYSKLLSMIVICLLVLQACGDDPVAVDEPVQPDMPQLEGVEMDDSYFEENNPPEEEMQDEEYMPFLMAKQGVMGMKMVFESAIQLPGLLLGASAVQEGEYENGVWTWEFVQFLTPQVTGEEEGFEVLITITAEVNEGMDSIDWEFVISESPFGTFTFMTMTTNLAYSEGEMNLFDPETSAQVLELSWDVVSETVKTLNFSFVDVEGEGGEMSVTYSEDAPQYSLTVVGQGEDFPIEITWDTDALEGMFSNPQTTVCWGEDLRAAAC